MCIGCWMEYGEPAIVNTKTQYAAELIAAVYEFSLVGGNLHCELDDWNIDDRFFEGEFTPFSPDVSSEQLKAETRCYNVLKALTFEERASALALYDKFIDETGQRPPEPSDYKEVENGVYVAGVMTGRVEFDKPITEWKSSQIVTYEHGDRVVIEFDEKGDPMPYRGAGRYRK